MKTNKFALGLSLTILFALSGGEAAHAQCASTKNPKCSGDSVQTQNKKQKMPHSHREAAAARLKVVHVKQRKQKLLNIAQAQHGYTGLGRIGGGQ
jgi:hypothetical protein